MNQYPAANAQGFANATRGLRHVFITKLAVQASIGIHPHERAATQTVWISVDVAVAEQDTPPDSSISDVVCYETISNQITAIIARGHIDLVETLAEMIADEIMADKRIIQLRVKIEKPEAIDAAESVGVAIERLQTANAVAT